MPDNDIVTDPTTGGTQPTSTTPAVPVKQETAKEHLLAQVASVSNTPTPNTATVPIVNTPQKIDQKQIDAKYKGNPYLVGGRDQWGGYLDADLPFSGTNVKKAVYGAANATGVDPSLLMASSLEEGMGGLIDNPQKTSTDYNVAVTGGKTGKPQFDKEKFPVDGYYSFGLDTFADQAPALIKKGLLPPDFAKNYQKFTAKNEQGSAVNTAAFTTEDAALQAKAAMLKNTRNNLDQYQKDNNITLTPRQQDFFNLVGYNAGEGNMQKMIQSYKEKGYLKDDKFLTDTNFKPQSFPAPYTYAQRRLFGRDKMNDQGNFSDYKPLNQPHTELNNQNRSDWNAFQDSGETNLADYIKKNPKTSLTTQMAGLIQQDLSAHKDHLKELVNNGTASYAPGVTHEDIGKVKHKFSDVYMASTK